MTTNEPLILAVIDDDDDVRIALSRLLRAMGHDVRWFASAEEFEAETGRHLGNTPQAFSHLALIEAAARIILAERLEEIG